MGVKNHRGGNRENRYRFQNINDISVDNDYNERRNLQATPASTQPPLQKMRITYDLTDFDTESPALKDYFSRVVQSCIAVYRKMLLISTPLIYPIISTQTICMNQQIPSNLLSPNPGVPYSDLHIVFKKSFENSNFLSRGGICQVSSDSFQNRPILGLIDINLKYYQNIDFSSDIDFSSEIETFLHGITHLVGFTTDMQGFFRDPENGYSKYNLAKAFPPGQISTPNLLKTAREYYGCNEMDGMLIEPENPNDSSHETHWERYLLQNELMTSYQVVGDASMSEFTISMIKDMGWYSISPEYANNHIEQSSWGYQRGCEFLNNNCQKTPLYPEFCDRGFLYPFLLNFDCDYDYYGTGICSDDALSNSCSLINVMASNYCMDTRLKNNPSSSTATYSDIERFGPKSRCFKSTITDSTQDSSFTDGFGTRCLEYDCVYNASSNQMEILIKLGDTNTVKCSNNGEKISAPPGYNGQLICPRDVNQFCQLLRPCSNYCNKKGFCMNGKCICNPRRFGSGCQFQCPGQCRECTGDDSGDINLVVCDSCTTGFILDNINKQCVSSCSSINMVYNPIRLICEPECSTDYSYSQIFLDQSQNECVTICPPRFAGIYSSKSCEPCQIQDCEQCKTALTECDLCMAGSFFSLGKCVAKCPAANFSDNTLRKCFDCPNNCSVCSTTSICTICLPGYQVDANNLCAKICNPGFFLDTTQNDCFKCSSNCASCKSLNDCEICQGGYEKNSSNGCVLVCQSGNFLDKTSNLCVACLLDCTKCTNDTSCDQCAIGKIWDTKYLKCRVDCDVKQFYNNISNQCDPCMNFCELCADKISCATCDQGYIWEVDECRIVCAANQFYQQSQKICSPCLQDCISCSDALSCNQCAPNNYWLINKCGTCATDQYFDNTNKVCIRCSESCIKCQNATTCELCSNDLYWIGTKCGVCQSNQYYDSSNQICQQCGENCSQCSNGSSCEICLNDLYWITNQCGKCSSSEFYDANLFKCLPCGDFCISCQNANTCDKCLNDLYWITSKCGQCASNEYYDLESTKCRACPDSCVSCQNGTSCEFCLNDLHWMNEKCMQCPSGQYYSNGSCAPCISNCLVCNNNSQCSKCESNYGLEKGVCIKKCNPEELFDTILQKCLACKAPCQSCQTTVDICTSCLDPNSQVISNTCSIVPIEPISPTPSPISSAEAVSDNPVNQTTIPISQSPPPPDPTPLPPSTVDNHIAIGGSFQYVNCGNYNQCGSCDQTGVRCSSCGPEQILNFQRDCTYLQKKAQAPEICSLNEFFIPGYCTMCSIENSFCNNCAGGVCQTCPEGRVINPLSGGCHFEQECHYSCAVCLKKDRQNMAYFKNCIICSSPERENFFFQQKICQCPKGSIDNGSYGCSFDNSPDKVKLFKFLYGIIIIGVVLLETFFGYFYMLTVRMIDISQLLSLYEYVSHINPMNSRENIRAINNLNFTPLFSIGDYVDFYGRPDNADNIGILICYSLLAIIAVILSTDAVKKFCVERSYLKFVHQNFLWNTVVRILYLTMMKVFGQMVYSFRFTQTIAFSFIFFFMEIGVMLLIRKLYIESKYQSQKIRIFNTGIFLPDIKHQFFYLIIYTIDKVLCSLIVALGEKDRVGRLLIIGLVFGISFALDVWNMGKGRNGQMIASFVKLFMNVCTIFVFWTTSDIENSHNVSHQEVEDKKKNFEVYPTMYQVMLIVTLILFLLETIVFVIEFCVSKPVMLKKSISKLNDDVELNTVQDPKGPINPLTSDSFNNELIEINWKINPIYKQQVMNQAHEKLNTTNTTE